MPFPFLPVALGLSGLFSFLGSRQQAKAIDRANQAPPWQIQNPRDLLRQLGLGADSPMGSYLTSGMLPPTSTTTSGSSNFWQDMVSNTLQTTKGQSTTMPKFTDQGQRMVDTLSGRIQQRVGQQGRVAPEEQRATIANMLDALSGAEPAVENRLSELGLLDSPVAAASRGAVTGARAGAVTQYQRDLPLIRRGRENEDLGMGFNLAELLRGSETRYSSEARSRTDQTTKGGSTSESTTSVPGQFDPSVLQWLIRPTGTQTIGPNPLSSVGNLLAMLAAMGVFPSGGRGGVGMPNNMGDILRGYVPPGG